MSLEKRIDDLIELYYVQLYYESTGDEDTWLAPELNAISEEVGKQEWELKQLRSENARLIEIATEKATRMDELYETLSKVVDGFYNALLIDDVEVLIADARAILNKNNPDGKV